MTHTFKGCVSSISSQYWCIYVDIFLKPSCVTTVFSWGFLCENFNCTVHMFLHLYDMPITVAMRSKAWTVFARSNAGIMGSNPIQGMDVCLCVYSVLCCPVCRWRPCDALITRPRRPTVCVKMITKLKKRPGSNKGLQSHWWMNEWMKWIYDIFQQSFWLTLDPVNAM
jgi:hypothetical protein